MKPLYAITAEMAAITRIIDECDGELPDDLEERLGLAVADEQQKVANYIRIIRNLESQEAVTLAEFEQHDQEAKRIRQIAGKYASARTRMLNYIKQHLLTTGQKRVDTGIGSVMLINNPPKVVGELTEETDARFVNVKTIRSLDKDKVLEAFKAGEPLPSNLQIERTQRVAVK